MGGILAQSAAAFCGGQKISIVCSTSERTEKRAKELGVRAETLENVCDSDYVFLAVKPQKLNELAPKIVSALNGKKRVLVSMLAGVSLDNLSGRFRTEKIIRIMPNTPASVGEGMTLVCKGNDVNDEELSFFLRMTESSGKCDLLQESLFDAASALSGCGPAYMFVMLEALADGAVKCGLPRDKALQYAAQTMLGSAKLLLESGEHPGKLKDAVCSPGGSTIAGVAALEKGGLRASAVDAVECAFLRTRELGKR